jgi:penicillin-binding protein 1A
MEMADAYLTFFREGVHADPRVLTKVTEGGTVLVEDKPTGQRRAVSREIAQQVREVLGQVVDRGSGTQAQIPGGAWGKTGTTDEFGDAWFVGANDKLVTAVWMGYPEGQSRPLLNVEGVNKVSGGTLPAFIFKKFMTKAAPSDAKATADPILDVRALNGSSSGSSGASRSTASDSATTTTEAPSPTTTVDAGPAVSSPAITFPAAPKPAAPAPTLIAPTIPVTSTTVKRTVPSITRPPGFP